MKNVTTEKFTAKTKNGLGIVIKGTIYRNENKYFAVKGSIIGWMFVHCFDKSSIKKYNSSNSEKIKSFTSLSKAKSYIGV